LPAGLPNTGRPPSPRGSNASDNVGQKLDFGRQRKSNNPNPIPTKNGGGVRHLYVPLPGFGAASGGISVAERLQKGCKVVSMLPTGLHIGCKAVALRTQVVPSVANRLQTGCKVGAQASCSDRRRPPLPYGRQTSMDQGRRAQARSAETAGKELSPCPAPPPHHADQRHSEPSHSERPSGSSASAEGCEIRLASPLMMRTQSGNRPEIAGCKQRGNRASGDAVPPIGVADRPIRQPGESLPCPCGGSGRYRRGRRLGVRGEAGGARWRPTLSSEWCGLGSPTSKDLRRSSRDTARECRMTLTK
jgi:hypothetical protein